MLQNTNNQPKERVVTSSNSSSNNSRSAAKIMNGKENLPASAKEKQLPKTKKVWQESFKELRAFHKKTWPLQLSFWHKRTTEQVDSCTAVNAIKTDKGPAQKARVARL
jgi:hypothetical protein